MKSDAPYCKSMRECLRKLNFLFWLSGVSLFFCDGAQARSKEAERILSKKHRKLKPPPRSLLAHRYSAENRYDVAWKRTLARSKFGEAQTTKPPKGKQKAPNPTQENSLIPPTPLSTLAQNSSQEVYSPFDDVAPYYQKSSTSPSYTSSRQRSQYKRQSIEESFLSLGLVGAGVYGVLGVEADLRLGDWNIGGGVGTGYDYRTWSLRGRYYMPAKQWAPFFEFGYAHWSLSEDPKDKKPGFPGYITKRFFSDDDGSRIAHRKVHLVYPGIGVMFLGPEHFAISLEAQYLVHLKDFQGGLIGALGLVKFF